MELEELPEAMQEAFKSLRFNSASIEYDVKDALEEAENLEDFQERVSDAMDSLIAEAQGVKVVLCGKDEPVVLDASKFLEWMHVILRPGDDRLQKYKTLWDLPHYYLPKCMFHTGFETACKVLPHDSAGIRISEKEARDISITWTNIPKLPHDTAQEAAA
jgi:hypothetical protein